MNEIKINMDNLSNEEREQLMALIEKANSLKSKVWKPEKYKGYYYISWCGVVESALNNDTADDKCYEIGNAFRTREEAEEEAERRKILTKWKRLSIESGEDENEWNGNNRHWYCYYNYSDNKMDISLYTIFKEEITYFPTKESLLNAIEEIGIPNVRKYILNVKE